MSQPTPSNETCPAELPNFCAQRHWSIFWLLIICSVTVIGGRVLTVQNRDAAGETPFFSANDRSRWATVRALGDEGVYAIDNVIADNQTKSWDTIDKVRHIDEKNEFHFYSSKPTLFPTLLAGVYRGVKFVTGKNLSDDTIPIVRLMLVLINVLPWAVYLFFLAKTINAVPVRDWARYYVLACAGFGTYLSTFAITLNNHLPAAVSIMIAVYCLAEIFRRPVRNWGIYFACGLFSAFAVANELPALSFLALAGLFCLIKSPVRTIFAFLPAVVVVGAGAFGTNYLAHHDWRPPYAHRTDGRVVATVEGDFENQLNNHQLPLEIQNAAVLQWPLGAPTVETGAWPGLPESTQRWVVRDQSSTTQFAILQHHEDREFEIRTWNNWYDYPGSYWQSSNDAQKSPVDRGESAREWYAFHVLFGHHGIFSLTPIWLLSFAGMIALLGGAKIAGRFQMRWLGVLGVLLTTVVLAFYIFYRPAMDRNYGGVSSALRWLFWLAPIWLVSMLPVVDWLARTKTGQTLCLILLAISAVSAMYAIHNPWVHPWLYEIWDVTGLRR